MTDFCIVNGELVLESEVLRSSEFTVVVAEWVKPPWQCAQWLSGKEMV